MGLMSYSGELSGPFALAWVWGDHFHSVDILVHFLLLVVLHKTLCFMCLISILNFHPGVCI